MGHTMAPLREVAGAEGIVRVHTPLPMSELALIQARLGSFTADPTTFIKQFQLLTQSYQLTYHDLFVVLTNALTPEENRRVLDQARAHADQEHLTNNHHPAGAAAVPDQDPEWDNNTEVGIAARNRYQNCLLHGLRGAAMKAINYEKLNEIIQDKNENPSTFLQRLTDGLRQHSKLDPESVDGQR